MPPPVAGPAPPISTRPGAATPGGPCHSNASVASVVATDAAIEGHHRRGQVLGRVSCARDYHRVERYMREDQDRPDCTEGANQIRRLVIAHAASRARDHPGPEPGWYPIHRRRQ